MLCRKWCAAVLVVVAVLVFGAREANACSCAPTVTVLEQYERSKVVVIAKVISIQKAGKDSEGNQDEESYGADGIKSAKLIAQKVFKGNLKAGDEMTFSQGGGADCIWTFSEESIGDEILFYTETPEKTQGLWYAGTCGRSRGLEYANDDLLYLNKINKVRGKTRIAGTLGFWYGEESDWSVANRIVRIIGKDAKTGEAKTYTAKTDKNGVYEIYELPAGKYVVQPDMPKGYKVVEYTTRRSRSYAGDENTPVKNQIPIVLEAKKHAALDIPFEIDNAIRGKVYDANGKLMKGVCLKAVLPDNEKKSGYHADCTEEDGSFAITNIPRGSYVLVINDEGKISSSEPFGKFYYPNATDAKGATIFNIGAGDFIENINVTATASNEVVTVEGLFLYADGKPLVEEWVKFAPLKDEAGIDAEVNAKTDKSGRFTIKLLKGVKGELRGELYVYSNMFERCPEIEAIIKTQENGFVELTTPAIAIPADGNLYDVKLLLPFAGCKKAK